MAIFFVVLEICFECWWLAVDSSRHVCFLFEDDGCFLVHRTLSPKKTLGHTQPQVAGALAIYGQMRSYMCYQRAPQATIEAAQFDL